MSNPDRATDTHALLANVPADHRTAVAALCDLPDDLIVFTFYDRKTGEPLGDVTVQQLLDDLCGGVAAPADVWRLLHTTYLVRPGLQRATSGAPGGPQHAPRERWQSG